MSNKGVSIRRANEDDIRSLVTLNYYLFQEDAGTRDPSMNLNWSLLHGESYFRTTITSEKYLCLVAEVSSLVAGYLTGYVYGPNDFYSFRAATLESMFVQKEHRNVGIATRLIENFKDWLQQNNTQRVTVTAFTANEAALRLYKKVGFRSHEVTLIQEIHHTEAST